MVSFGCHKVYVFGSTFFCEYFSLPVELCFKMQKKIIILGSYPSFTWVAIMYKEQFPELL